MSSDTSIFAEGVRDVSLANGVLRITFDRMVKENQTEASGTLLIPLVRAGHVIGGLAQTWNGIREKLRAIQKNGGAGQSTPQMFDDGGNLNL